MMNAMQSVGDWVAEDFSRAAIFESLGIDYCCGGKRPLKIACEEKGIDVESVLRMVTERERKDEMIDFKSLLPAELCDHIERVHHRYLKEKLPFIQRLLEKIYSAHGEEYRPLLDKFILFKKDLMSHMEKEEQEVFPKLRLGSNAVQDCQSLEKEHDEAKEFLLFFRNFTNGYKIPKDCCMTHKTAILELEALEKEMHAHVYKENHLLFPQALDRKPR